jgi:hypothetical protein
MVGRKDAAVDDADAGQRSDDRAGDLGNHRMPGGRAGMPEQHRIRRATNRMGDEVRRRHGAEFAVDELDDMPIVQQRPADGEQAERRQVVVGNAAADGWVGYVDEENTHRLPFHAEYFTVQSKRRWKVMQASSLGLPCTNEANRRVPAASTNEANRLDGASAPQ